MLPTIPRMIAGQEWGSTALALHQAISALATQRSAAAASAGTKSARRFLSSSQPVHASTLPSHAADDPSQPLQHSQLHLEHSHGQVAGQPGSFAMIQMQHSSVTLGDGGAAATDDDNRAAGATADDDNRAAGATADHDSRAAGATADDDNRAAGATADDDNRAAGATADDDNRDANANAASCLTDTGAIDEEPPPGVLAPSQAAAARQGFHFANDLLGGSSLLFRLTLLCIMSWPLLWPVVSAAHAIACAAHCLCMLLQYHARYQDLYTL